MQVLYEREALSKCVVSRGPHSAARSRNEVEGALVTSQLRKLEDWRTQHMSLLHMLEVGICVHLGQ